MNPISFPKEYNYCAAFLTLACNLKCSYCINIMDFERKVIYWENKPLDGDAWIKALNRIEAREDLPITFQGGEPTVHPAFYEIVRGVDKPMDLITNIQFDPQEFMDEVPKTKFMRHAPYASIRVSYHPEQMKLEPTVEKVVKLQENGYQIGVWMVEHPNWLDALEQARFTFSKYQVDFRTKELLGRVDDKVYGHLKYKNAVGSDDLKYCKCRTSELIIGPSGKVYRCHSDLYNLRADIGHILDDNFNLDREFKDCYFYGDCSGCDIKVKTNRFQEFGHTSVEIIDIEGDENENIR